MSDQDLDDSAASEEKPERRTDWWNDPQRINFGARFTPIVETMMTTISKITHRDVLTNHDLSDALDLSYFTVKNILDGLHEVGLVGRMGGGYGLCWFGSPRLIAYVGSGFNLNNKFEDSLLELAAEARRESERAAYHGRALANYDPARHKQRHFDQSTKHHNAATAHADAYRQAFLSLAGCHIEDHRQHFDKVVAGHNFGPSWA